MTYPAVFVISVALAALPVTGLAAPGARNLEHFQRTPAPAATADTRSAIDSCPAAALELPGSVAGSLTPSDCALTDLLPRFLVPAAARQNPGDVYRLEVQRRSVVRLEMRSSEFDARMYLVTPGTGALIAQDDNSLSDRNAGMSVHLNPGTYLLVASSMSAPAGEYSITSAAEDPRLCTERQLGLNVELEGTLGDPDCRFLDLRPGSSDRTFLDPFVVRVSTRGVLTVTMKSPDSDAYLLFGDDVKMISADNDSGGGTDARVTASVDPGTYIVLATTVEPSPASYRISARLDPQRTCPVETLSRGEVRQGDLSDTDCRMLDLFTPSDGKSYVDKYEFELAQPALVTVTMRSTAFDTLVEILDSEGQSIDTNDDFEGSSTDSRLKLSLKAGKYSIVASAYDEAIGAYQIQFETEDLRPCDVRAMAVPDKVSGVLSPSDCRVLDYVVPEATEEVVDVYSVKLDSRQVLTANLSTTGFTGAVLLLNAAKQVVNFGLPVQREGSSAAETLLLPGEYTLMVISVDETLGAYDLTTEAREPKACPVTALPLAESVNGSLSATDCRVREVVPASTTDFRADQFAITVPERRTVTVTVTPENPSQVFVALPMDEQYRRLDARLQLAPGASTATFTAEPGRYIIIVGPLSEATGSYTVRANTTAPAAVQ